MGRSSDPVKVAAWRERMVRFDSSEMKTAAFCAAEGVSLANFYAWRRKLGLSKPRASKQPARSAFRQVVVNSAPALAARLPGGVEIEASGADEQALRTIVNALVRAGQECEAQSC